MPKPKKGPRLGSNPGHQRLLLSTLAAQLFTHEAIDTTEAKAKALRPYAERLITKAKRGDLASRRDVLKDIPDGHFEVSISTTDGTQVTYSTTMDGGRGPMFIRQGRHELTAEFEVVLLPRDYTIDLGIHHRDGRTADFVQRCRDFSVIRVAETGNDHFPWPRTRGFVRAEAAWVASTD